MSLNINLSLQSRIIVSFVLLTISGLFLFGLVVHDNSLIFKQNQEQRFYTTISDQFFEHVLGHEESFNNLKESLLKHNNFISDSNEMFLILDNKNNILLKSKSDASSTEIFKTIISNNTNKTNSDSFESNGNYYFWASRNISNKIIHGAKLILVYPLASSAQTEFYKIFGIPLVITSLVLLWAVVWGAIILSSLISKLQMQKGDIKQSHDEALTANRAKSYFLANMSHEIRTPLTSIIGFAESCMEKESTAKERKHAIKTIIKSGTHLMNLINEILDLSKVEAGKVEIKIKPVSLLDILDEVNEFIIVLAEEKGLAFTIKCAYPLPKTVETDALRLKQILLNLCSNAVKFTYSGQVYLNVSYLSETDELNFDVIDTGIGLSKEELDHIFNPFEQADSSTTREFGGTGLGLTLSKQLTDLLKGKILVESEIDKGSRFTLKLPINKISNNEFYYNESDRREVPKKLQQEYITPKFSGNILIAEDNLDIQDLISLLLRKVGVNFDIVKNGREAIMSAMNSNYDLVILDIQMPIMDGLSAVKELRKKGYSRPIIAMTANAMQKDCDQCIEAGFDEFVSKPIDRKLLYEKVGLYLKSGTQVMDSENIITSELLVNEPELIDLIDKFIKRLPVMQEEINEFFKNKKWDEFSGIIHQMKGVGGGYGYPMLTELCALIEIQLRNKDYDELENLVAEFNDMAGQIINGDNENHKIAER